MSVKKSFLTLPIILITLGHLAVDLGQGAIPVLLPFIKEKFVLTYTQVGIVVLVQNFTSSIIQPLFGYFIDKIYVKAVLPISIFIAAIGMSLTGIATSYYWLLFVVVIAGFGSASFHPQGAVAINAASDASSRGKSMGLFSVGGNLGFALGSLFMVFLLKGLSNGLEGTLYFCLPGIVVAILIWLNLNKISYKVNNKKSNDKIEEKENTPPIPWFILFILLALIFVRSTIHSALQTYIPLYYINYLHQEAIYASYLVFIFLFGGAVGTFVGASLSDHFGRKTVIVGSMLMSLPLVFAIPYTSGLVAAIIIFLSGFSLVASFATTLVLAQEMMPGNIGMASGLTVGFSLGLGGVGTTLLGVVADNFNLSTVFLILGVLPILGIALSLKLPGRQALK